MELNSQIKNCIQIAKWNLQYSKGYSNLKYFNFPDKIDAFSTNEFHVGDSIQFKYDMNLLDKVDDVNILKENPLYIKYDGFYQHKIYIDSNGFIIWCFCVSRTKEPILIYKLNNQWNHCTLIYDITNTNGKYAFEYFNKIFSYFVLNYDAIVLHGVLMEYNNKGIIISAPSGVGKTTHARMWRDTQRALIINGDRALCRKINGNWTGFGMPWCGTSGEYINRDIKINAIVVLEQDDENSVERLDMLNAFNFMMPNILAPTWENNLLNKAIDCLEDILSEIPVFKLKCRPELNAVEVLKKEIDKL